jgi:hypothetical protein
MMEKNQKTYRLIMRWANGATEEVEPYSRAEVAKYLLPESDLDTELERWENGYAETNGEVEFIHFVGDIPEGVSLNRPDTECRLNTYRLILEDGTFFEKEFLATDDPETDALNACQEMVLRMSGGLAMDPKHRSKEFCRLIRGCENAYDLNDILETTLINVGFRLDGLTDDQLTDKYEKFLNVWGDSLDSLKHSAAEERFWDQIIARGLRQYTADIILYGEDGENAARDCKVVWARNIGEATNQAMEWASEIRDQTGDPWQFMQVIDDRAMEEQTCTYSPFPDFESDCQQAFTDYYDPPYEDEDDQAGQYCDSPERPKENILDDDLPPARADLPGMKLEQLCNQAIEIANAPPIERPGQGQVERYLHDLNLEIIKRVVFWTLITLLLALSAAAGGGALTLHLMGGTMLKSLLNGSQIAFAAAVLMGALGIANKKLIVLENWASTLGANAAKRRREELERREWDESGESGGG